jgi:hypothetical protein
MPSPVYSTRLFEALALTTNVGYTVPAGVRAVLRDVDIFIGAHGTETAFAILGGMGQVIWYVDVASATTGQSFQWRGRQVFNPGDIISFVASANGVDVSASGYLLTLP